MHGTISGKKDDEHEELFVMTASGGRIDIPQPKPGQFKIEDVAYALSNINRYCGQTSRPISVAAHSIDVADRVYKSHTKHHDEQQVEGPRTASIAALQALLHDAHEMVTSDIPTPVKRLLARVDDLPCGCGILEHLQQNLDFAIFEDLGLLKLYRTMEVPEVVTEKSVMLMAQIISREDVEAGATERANLLPASDDWPIDEDARHQFTPWMYKLYFSSPERLRELFTQKYALLWGEAQREAEAILNFKRKKRLEGVTFDPSQAN